MTLEQFVAKATLLVDEARYPAKPKDRMVHDTFIAGISNDVVWGKIIKKGPNITLTQILEISRLKTATQQSLSEMSNTNPSVNHVRYNMKKKNKGEKLSQQQSLGKFHGSGSLPSNYCWNSQLDSITKISIKRYCLKLIQVLISIVSVLEPSTNSFQTSDSTDLCYYLKTMEIHQ